MQFGLIIGVSSFVLFPGVSASVAVVGRDHVYNFWFFVEFVLQSAKFNCQHTSVRRHELAVTLINSGCCEIVRKIAMCCAHCAYNFRLMISKY